MDRLRRLLNKTQEDVLGIEIDGVFKEFNSSLSIKSVEGKAILVLTYMEEQEVVEVEEVKEVEVEKTEEKEPLGQVEEIIKEEELKSLRKKR